MAQLANGNAIRHGATSLSHIRPVARNHRRRVLRQIGLRSADLDAIGRGYLDLYVRLSAKLELLDAHFATVGLLKDDGEPQGATKFYVSIANSTRLALARLEEHVRARGNADPVKALDAYIAEQRGSVSA